MSYHGWRQVMLGVLSIIIIIIQSVIAFFAPPAQAQAGGPGVSHHFDDSEWEHLDEIDVWVRRTQNHGTLTFKRLEDKLQYSVTQSCGDGRSATYTWYNFDPEAVAGYGCTRKNDKIFIRHIRPYFRSLPDWALTGRKPAEIPVERYHAGIFA